MLRSAGIRSKILAVLVLPLMLLGIAAGLLATQQVQHARQAHEVEKIAAVSGAFAQLVRGIAAERAATAAAMQGSEAAAETLPGVRAQVDEGLARARESVGGVDFSRLSTQAEQALGNVERAHVELGLLRETVDRDGAPVDTVMASFGDILREDLAMPGRVAAGVDDLRTADLLVGYGHLLTTRDLALREQEVGLRILAGAPTAADARTFATLGDDQTEEVARWQFAVGSEAADEAAQLVGRQTRTVWSIARARVALTSPATVDQTGLTPELWTEITDARVEGLDEALAGIAAEVDSQAEAASSRATTLAAMAAGGAVLGVGITLLLSLVLSRRIVRPLRELTSAATSVRELLPQMVEQVRVPGAMPDVELPRIAVSGDDEVGRLAAAFNDVNDTVLRVAEEQAALRGSIAETFVNVARRNQVLLSRQLAFIDRLEQREEDPDTLDSLFRLDHLATRMRRNAESLLVLANIEAGRRLRQPLALSDVIRTAAGEIEQYERISLQLQVDPPTMGHLSLQLAHLLAELLENGTNFSEPHAPVVVTTASTGSTIRVTVADEGLGLTDEELEAARDKVSTSAADDVVTSQRLGYYVVGRLARRLGVTVSIARGATKGLVVTVDLPPSLFVPGSVEVLDPADQARSVLLGGTSPQAAVLEAPPAEVDPRSSGPVPSAHAVPRAAGVPATGSGAPTAPVVGPAPSLPPAAVPSSPLLMPALAPETGTSAEVRVAPNGASLPRRDRTASAAVTGPAVLPAAGSAGRGAPADAETLTGAGSTSQPPVVSALPADEVTRPALAGPAHGRRAGLFGAFRARREVPVGDPADSLRPGPVPATMAEKPQTRGVPPQAARTSRARPEAPTGATAVAPVPQVSPTVEPQARASVPERAPVPAPGPVGAPQTAPSAAGARPGAGASRPLPAPMVSPVDILPAHGRRRARRGGLGGGRPPTPPEGLASDPVLPDQREVWEGTRTVGGPVPGASGGPAPAAPAGAPALPAGAVPSGLEPRGGGTGVPPQGGVPGPRPAGHRTGTPAATGTAAPAAGTAGRHPVGPSVGELRGLADGEEVRQRSMLASEALSELSRLSSYSPASVAGRSTPVPLVRRQPAVSEVAERSVPAARVPEPRQRDAAQVRTMLSGFQSGVSRGRAGDEGVVGGTDRSTAHTDGVTPTSPAAPPPLGGSPDDRASGSGATSTTTSTSNDTSTTD